MLNNNSFTKTWGQSKVYKRTEIDFNTVVPALENELSFPMSHQARGSPSLSHRQQIRLADGGENPELLPEAASVVKTDPRYMPLGV